MAANDRQEDNGHEKTSIAQELMSVSISTQKIVANYNEAFSKKATSTKQIETSYPNEGKSV